MLIITVTKNIHLGNSKHVYIYLDLVCIRDVRKYYFLHQASATSWKYTWKWLTVHEENWEAWFAVNRFKFLYIWISMAYSKYQVINHYTPSSKLLSAYRKNTKGRIKTMLLQNFTFSDFFLQNIKNTTRNGLLTTKLKLLTKIHKRLNYWSWGCNGYGRSPNRTQNNWPQISKYKMIWVVERQE